MAGLERTVWRITTKRFAASAFSGEGARLYGGRWNRVGQPLVYTAESRSLALLEMLVQDEPLRAHYMLIPATLPSDLKVVELSLSDLPPHWRTLAARDVLQTLGADWLARADGAVLAVPSAVMPAERNYLLNPLHPDFRRIGTGEAEPLETDIRLLRDIRG
ncbi:RES family NAD+ phosphorylase [Azohydromonas lata]|uniref:RES family NAD+ phosphorylase n=1 Tax=Azohydromonas lata TaxID=45677 RepID=UPI000836BADE|nr:RES family NAD+ phosphorylase [Azohydromonas lata]